ncbi:MAG: autotransporter outer membrane beta-barrel domain-containing protein [Opitutae bacterium]|nr:autotransporter outer membrane beta-barrel domain-containing protein [Opitutae bacterium]
MNLKTLASLSFVAALSTAAFAQVSNFDTLNGYASGVDVRLARARAEMLRAGRAEGESNLVVSADYINRKVDAAVDSIERSAHGESGRVGYNWRFNEWSVGAAIGYGNIRTDYNEINSPAPVPLHGYVTATSTEGIVWVGYKSGAWRFSAVGAVGTTKNKGRRTSDAGSSFADYDSSDSSFGLTLSREIPVSDALVVEPFVGLSFASSSTDGFTEQGTSPDRRIVRDFSMDENRGAIGVRVAGRQSDWTPFASVAWLSRFSGGDSNISNTASNGSNLGVGFVPAASKGLVFVGAGLSGKLDDNWNVAGTIEYFAGGDERAFGLSLTVGRKF